MQSVRIDITLSLTPRTVPVIDVILPLENGLTGTLTTPDPLKSPVNLHSLVSSLRVYPYLQVLHD